MIGSRIWTCAPLALGLAFAPSGCSPEAPRDNSPIAPEQEVFYYVFQRSFYDADGDGHGDLAGLTQKLDYLEDLGVTSILMTPLYESIYYHNYFPDDFETIDPEFGTRDDYDRMIAAIHERGMRFYMDMEVQYVTKNHEWFADSYENPESQYSERLFYNGPGNTEPETIVFDLTGLESYNGDWVDITTINLKNEAAKRYIYDQFLHWVDPNGDGDFGDGVDGFRIDHMMDDLDNKGLLTNLFSEFWAPLFEEIRADNPNVRIVAEQADWGDDGGSYFDEAGVDFVFSFGTLFSLLEFDRNSLSSALESAAAATPDGKHQLLFVENHDLDRYATVVGGDDRKLRLGGAMTMLAKGTPILYYGQEIGMRGSGGFGKYGSTDGNDIPRREAFEWHETVEGPGMALWYKDTGPWWDDSQLRAGDGISVEEQRDDASSTLNFYRRMIDLRRTEPALAFGSQTIVANDSENVLTFVRENGGSAFLIALNLGGDSASARIPYATAAAVSADNTRRAVLVSGDGDLRDDTEAAVIWTGPYGYALFRLQ